MAKKKKKEIETSTPYKEFKKQPSQRFKEQYLQLSLPLNHGVNEV